MNLLIRRLYLGFFLTFIYLHPSYAEEYVPGAARKGMEWQYFVGSCSDPKVQEQIKKNFIEALKQIIGQGDPTFCESQQVCQLENVKVKCGATSGRKRRAQVG